MIFVAAALSELRTALIRYSRSRGLWLLLLVGPIGARFMVARDDGAGFQVALGGHLPVLTSAALGVSLGIVVSTLLLPIGFIYLRSNITSRRPWQLEEVTPASNVAISLGRFGADAAVLIAMLAALTIAGCFLAWMILPGHVHAVQIAVALWLVAAPALLTLAALHRLFDAFPAGRRWLGDVTFFVLWSASLAMPLAVGGDRSSFVVNMCDFAGFVRPIVGDVPARGRQVSIGSSNALLPGRVPVDVVANLEARGYVASRFAWAAFALLLAALAGIIHRPRKPMPRRQIPRRLAQLLSPSSHPAPIHHAAAPRAIGLPLAGLVAAEFRLIGRGRPFQLLALAAAAAGLLRDYRHVGSPAALLLLVFALSSHAGRSEAGLLKLSRIAALGPYWRRFSFVIAAVGWGLLLALPAAIIQLSFDPLMLAAGAAAVASAAAILLAAVGRSSFAPRFVLLAAWYIYMSS